MRVALVFPCHNSGDNITTEVNNLQGKKQSVRELGGKAGRSHYSYDNQSRPLSVLHQAGGATIDGGNYAMDAAGNRTAGMVNLCRN